MTATDGSPVSFRRAAGLLAIPPPFQSVDDVVVGLAALARELQAARDLRGLFVIAYMATTHTLAQWIERGIFLDNQAATRYVVAFANEYRRALAGCVTGERSSVPVAWQQFFDACDERSGTAFQCLMLGINAHVNRDLPYAVIEAGVDVECTSCYQDYARINDVARLNVPLVRQRVGRAYGREFSLGQRWFGRVIDAYVARSLERARRHSWSLAQLLARASTESARAQVDRVIERRATAAGQKILGSENAAGCVAALYKIAPPPL